MAEDSRAAPQQTPGVTEEELRVAYEGPALASNRFYAATTSTGLRIAFAEQYASNLPVFRNAVLLSYTDAIQLRDLLVGMLADVERQINQQATFPKDNGNA